MTALNLALLAVAIVGLVTASLLLLGLCRAAADLREVEPDNGEYHD